MLQTIEITGESDSTALPPVKLIRGRRNHLQLVVANHQVNPANTVRRYAAITRLGQLLSLETENIGLTIQDNNALVINLSSLELNTAEIKKWTVDQRPVPDVPDVDGEFTFCRANLEIALFDNLTGEEACLLINLAVEIHARQYLSGNPAPAPAASYYTKTETDRQITDALTSVFGNYLTQYGEVLNGRFL